jgi:hypothetical protein
MKYYDNIYIYIFSSKTKIKIKLNNSANIKKLNKITKNEKNLV